MMLLMQHNLAGQAYSHVGTKPGFILRMSANAMHGLCVKNIWDELLTINGPFVVCILSAEVN